MRFLKNYNLFNIIFFAFCMNVHLLAQEATPDTSLQTGSRTSGLEGPIIYEAQVIDNWMIDRKTVLSGRAKVTYQNMTLTGEKITVDWDGNTMLAEGVWDTVWVMSDDHEDSTQAVRLTGLPEFIDAGDVMTGETMIYNFKTKKGRILRGRTAYEDGFYSGATVKMVKPKSLNVADAVFTTCDKEEDPHFHFWSQKMRIDVNKKVIAKPLVLYIGKIPVLALPFLYFPMQKGRQSGILIPRYGESTMEGRYLRGLGYYWAASEYWDVKGTVDFFEKSGFLLRSDFRYNMRYKFQGSISGTWTRKDFDVLGTKERRWDLSVRHSQTISPTTRVSVNGLFVSSGNLLKDISANREQRLRQEIRSNAKLIKRLGTTGKLEVTLNQTRNLKTEAVSELLPQITLSNRWANLIPGPRTQKGVQGEKRWYNAFTIPYNTNVLLKRNRQKLESGSVINTDGLGWDHALGMYVSPTLFGWLNVRPSIDYKATMFDRRKEYYLDSETNTIQSREKKGFFMLQTYGTSVSFNTKIYGAFQPRFLKNVMVRHVVTPRLSFIFRPDFSDEKYGYFQAVEDTQGVEQYRDRYSGSIFRSTPTGESQSMSFGVDNVFQMKMGEGENEKKIELFKLNFSSAYNWKAPQFRLSDLSSSLRADPSRSISLDMRTSHSFYQYEEGQKIDRLYFQEITIKDWKSFLTKKWARLTRLSLNLNLRLKGTARSGGSADESMPVESDAMLSDVPDLANLPGDRLDFDERMSGFDIPWNLTARLSYTDSRSNPDNPSKKFWASMNLDFNLTKKWKVSYRSQWDLLEGKPVSQDFVFQRDLHCWEALITWTPTGYNKRFYFRIGIKSSMLKDVKFERGKGARAFSGSSLQRMF